MSSPRAPAFGWDTGATLAERFRRWAGDSRRVYPYAVRAMADDWDAGGPVREICAGYEDANNGAVIQLRVLAGVFRLVLTGRAEELRPYYPCLGGTADPAAIWPALRQVLAAHVAELQAACAIPPQTNEVGRSAALLVGLQDLVAVTGRSRIRLLEVGASGGLNLLLDRFAISGPGWRHGPEDSPLQLDHATDGPLDVQPFAVVGRRGCDLHPIDPTGADGRLLLTSFVWPDDVHRFERLRAAFAVVDQVGAPPVDAAPAAGWLRSQLADKPDPQQLTVVWNSITQQYWPRQEIDTVEDLLRQHGARAPLARVSMEFRHDTGPDEYPELWTTWWPGDGSTPRQRLIGHAHHHGIPVYLDGPAGD